MAEGNIIASRALQLPDGTSLKLNLFQPQPSAGGDDWICHWELRGDADGRVFLQHAAHGIDAVQALELAMVMVGGELPKLQGLTWFGSSWLGFQTADETLLLGQYRRRRDGRAQPT